MFSPVTLTVAGIRDEVLTALHTVTDPEVDRPITELGYVRSILVDDEGVAVHLRLPTADRSPNFAYLVVSDALDAVRDAEIGEVRMLLDDHHQVHVHDHLDRAFAVKAHTAAMQRCVTELVRRDGVPESELCHLTLRDLPPGPGKVALLRRRMSIGLSTCPNSRVMVAEDGRPLTAGHANPIP